MVLVSTEYISVGGNRHPSAADWDADSGLLAYGTDNNAALWDPLVRLSSNFYEISEAKYLSRPLYQMGFIPF